MPDPYQVFPMQATAIQAVEGMMSSADSDAQIAAVLLVDDVVLMPASIGSDQGTLIAARNRALIGESGIVDALAHLLNLERDESSPRVLYMATVCVDAISLLLKRVPCQRAMHTLSAYFKGLQRVFPRLQLCSLILFRDACSR